MPVGSSTVENVAIDGRVGRFLSVGQLFQLNLSVDCLFPSSIGRSKDWPG